METNEVDGKFIGDKIDNYRQTCYSFDIEVERINSKSTLHNAYPHYYDNSHIYVAEASNLGSNSKTAENTSTGKGKKLWTDNDNEKWSLISSMFSTVAIQKDNNIKDFSFF